MKSICDTCAWSSRGRCTIFTSESRDENIKTNLCLFSAAPFSFQNGPVDEYSTGLKTNADFESLYHKWIEAKKNNPNLRAWTLAENVYDDWFKARNK